MKKFMKENYLNSNIKLNRFNGFLSVKDYKGFRSAFIKDLYLEEVDINSLGILNDNIADTKHHGGKNKALFANSYHNYGLWENFLGKKLACGMMGENLTLKIYTNKMFV